MKIFIGNWISLCVGDGKEKETNARVLQATSWKVV